MQENIKIVPIDYFIKAAVTRYEAYEHFWHQDIHGLIKRTEEACGIQVEDDSYTDLYNALSAELTAMFGSDK